jgi:hypothetical protein
VVYESPSQRMHSYGGSVTMGKLYLSWVTDGDKRLSKPETMTQRKNKTEVGLRTVCLCLLEYFPKTLNLSFLFLYFHARSCVQVTKGFNNRLRIMPHLFSGLLIQSCDICSKVAPFMNTAVLTIQIYKCNIIGKICIKIYIYFLGELNWDKKTLSEYRTVRELRLAQRHFWIFKSCGMWSRVDRWKITDVSKDQIASIYRDKHSIIFGMRDPAGGKTKIIRKICE